jgi:GTP cyclohydrolase II
MFQFPARGLDTGYIRGWKVGAMPLAPVHHRTPRPRAGDLRMGVPVVLTVEGRGGAGGGGRNAVSRRGWPICGRWGPVLAITARRAETLKARAYDGDLARIACAADDAGWPGCGGGRPGG